MFCKCIVMWICQVCDALNVQSSISIESLKLSALHVLLRTWTIQVMILLLALIIYWTSTVLSALTCETLMARLPIKCHELIKRQIWLYAIGSSEGTLLQVLKYDFDSYRLYEEVNFETFSKWFCNPVPVLISVTLSLSTFVTFLNHILSTLKVLSSILAIDVHHLSSGAPLPLVTSCVQREVAARPGRPAQLSVTAAAAAQMSSVPPVSRHWVSRALCSTQRCCRFGCKMRAGDLSWLTLHWMLAATDWMRLDLLALRLSPALLWLGDVQARPPCGLWQLLDYWWSCQERQGERLFTSSCVELYCCHLL